jgi:hypothetical protein
MPRISTRSFCERRPPRPFPPDRIFFPTVAGSRTEAAAGVEASAVGFTIVAIGHLRVQTTLREHTR